jgi:Delta3-Delta2-enoyl-CoA isomerase
VSATLVPRNGSFDHNLEEAMIDLERDGELFILTMNDGENRWNTSFVRAFAKVLDEVEASSGPAALVTRSSDVKFFSNGLDLDWISGKTADPVDPADPINAASNEHRGGDRSVFGAEFMTLMGRIITLPIPTVAAINGHGFGAGFMVALCHDVRIMRSDRGFLCANEMQLGMTIPRPELALFRHKLSASTFFETVQLARRWSGPDALTAGIVSQIADVDTLLDVACTRARELAPLGANRAAYGAQKESLFGENSALHEPHGAAHMLKQAYHLH